MEVYLAEGKSKIKAMQFKITTEYETLYMWVPSGYTSRKVLIDFLKKHYSNKFNKEINDFKKFEVEFVERLLNKERE